jgi:uncharacterized membrane protein
MDTERSAQIALEQIPADRRLVEELSSHGLITQDARDYALQLLYPHKNWGLWVSRLLLVVGVSLILAGIVYFFAFNWAKITPMTKLGSIQLSILGCLVATYGYGLKRLSGKILLLSACVLVGVFLAVFGQIYQTGADAYNLFMMWSLLIVGWVVISEFAALWAVWLVITNVFLTLYWDQAALPDREMEMMITSILAALNLTFLGLREYFVHKGTEWLSERWTRVILIIPILVCLLIPTIMFIVEPNRATSSIGIGAVFGLIAHAGLFIIYRYKLPDMWSLSAVFLSSCIILESAGFKLLSEIFNHADAALFLLAGIMTIGIFTFAIVMLRQIAKNMEVSHVR